MIRFRYITRHMPTGHETVQERHFDTELHFYRQLDRWNRSHPGIWHYRSKPYVYRNGDRRGRAVNKPLVSEPAP